MKEKLQAFLAALKQGAKDLWNRYNIYIILSAAVLIFFKYRDWLIDVLVNSGKRTMDDAKKQDEVLAKKEDDAKAQADDLVKKAQDEPNQEKPVNDNWYKDNK